MANLQEGVLERSQMFFYAGRPRGDAFFYPLSAGHFYCDSRYRVQRARFDSVLLVFVARGGFSFLDGGQEQTAKKGEIAVVNCFGPHAYYTKTSFEGYWLHVAGANTWEIFAELTGRFGPVVRAGEMAGRQLRELYDALRRGAGAGEMEMSFRVYRLIAELFRAQQTAAPESGVVSEAVELIRREYARPLTVDELAGQVGLSPSQFSRRFKRQTGASPYAYLLGVRLAKAKELLKNTSLPVGEIAFRAGFANESNFIYYFKKQEGMPPLRFRSAIF